MNRGLIPTFPIYMKGLQNWMGEDYDEKSNSLSRIC